MKCPKCGLLMVPLKIVECGTGKAQLHRCYECRAMFYEQLTKPTPMIPALRPSSLLAHANAYQ